LHYTQISDPGCEKASGKTPGVLIDELIVAESRLRLKGSDQTITMIAEDMHFSDQASFSKFFKRRTGQTPLAFRKHK
jgi:AraC-like DNA-binding protein